MTSLPAFPTSIAALAFNHDGTELAIASSYTFEEGDVLILRIRHAGEDWLNDPPDSSPSEDYQ